MEPFVQLGATSPGPGELRSTYVCPARKNALVKAIIACNRGSADTTIRVTLAQSETQIGLNDYIFFDTPLIGNDTLVYSHEGDGLPVGPGLEIMCRSASGDVTFKILGQETYLKPPT